MPNKCKICGEEYSMFGEVCLSCAGDTFHGLLCKHYARVAEMTGIPRYMVEPYDNVIHVDFVKGKRR